MQKRLQHLGKKRLMYKVKNKQNSDCTQTFAVSVNISRPFCFKYFNVAFQIQQRI